jgi:hypothetical protein
VRGRDEVLDGTLVFAGVGGRDGTLHGTSGFKGVGGRDDVLDGRSVFKVTFDSLPEMLPISFDAMVCSADVDSDFISFILDRRAILPRPRGSVVSSFSSVNTLGDLLALMGEVIPLVDAI